jgi:hypothetical protein
MSEQIPSSENNLLYKCSVGLLRSVAIRAQTCRSMGIFVECTYPSKNVQSAMKPKDVKVSNVDMVFASRVQMHGFLNKLLVLCAERSSKKPQLVAITQTATDEPSKRRQKNSKLLPVRTNPRLWQRAVMIRIALERSRAI